MRPWTGAPECTVPPQALSLTTSISGTTTGVRRMTIQGDVTQQDQQADGVVLTDAAASKVKSLLEQEGRDDLRLRLAVQPGGCSGLRYQLFFDERDLDGDTVREFGGVGVVVD